MAVVITGAQKKSPAEQLNIEPGSRLLAVNGHEINDVLDYGFYTADAKLALELQSPDGRAFSVVVEKEPYEELGLLSEEFLMAEQHSCQNKCIFCFIDQLPKGMRAPLYFKDDDERLSFLFGNYVTLTNLSDAEVQRIIDMRISPVNVSVHTTDPALRCEVMGNRFAGDKLSYLYRLADAGIALNCQIVLCRGVNDGAHLEKTMRELAALAPNVGSVAVVPAGLTAHREGLYALKPYDKASGEAVLGAVLAFGEQCLSEYGARLIYPADEWFLLAGREIPPLEFYEELLQIENGVGMLALLRDEFEQALARAKPVRLRHARKVDLITGEAAAPFLGALFEQNKQRIGAVEIAIHAVKNEFFGGNVSVAGLLTGADVMAQLDPRSLGSGELLMPRAALRSEGDRMLDDVTPLDLEQYFNKKILFCASGEELLAALQGR